MFNKKNIISSFIIVCVLIISFFSINLINEINSSSSADRAYLQKLEVATQKYANYVKEAHPGSALDSARKITSGYCDASSWGEYATADANTPAYSRGKAIVNSIENTDGTFNRYTTLSINPLMKGSSLEHIAWHECAHGKMLTYNKSETKTLSNEAKKVFSNCTYKASKGLNPRADECLADAMAFVKTGHTDSSLYGYHSNFTSEQLALAEKAWEAGFEATKIQINTTELDLYKEWVF